MTELELTWQGPFSFKDFLNGKVDFYCPGVYLWKDSSVPQGTYYDEHVNYIGKANSLSLRQKQHYSFQIGGIYSIPNYRIKFSREDPNRRVWSLDMRKPDPNVVDTISDVHKFIEIVKKGFEYANNIQIYVAKAEKVSLADIERNLLYALQPYNTDWGTGTAPGKPLKIIHSNARATWASASILKGVSELEMRRNTEAEWQKYISTIGGSLHGQIR